MPIIFEPIPETLDEAVVRLASGLTEKEWEYVAASAFLADSHHGVGRTLRNEWGLWSGGPLREFFKTTYGLGHADDMSSMILEALRCHVTGNVFNAEVKAAYYREYWKKQKIDPLHPSIDEANAKRASE